jgi:hypothetical protein
MDAYRKLADAQRAAGHYDDAIATLNLYLLGKPADTSDAQDEIYRLRALKQAAAEEALRKQQEAQRAADEERQRQAEAEERRHREEEEDFLRRLDGGRFVNIYSYTAVDGSHWTRDDEMSVSGTKIEYSDGLLGRAPILHMNMTISGKKACYDDQPNNCCEIGDDGNSINCHGTIFRRER